MFMVEWSGKFWRDTFSAKQLESGEGIQPAVVWQMTEQPPPEFKHHVAQ